MNHLTLPRFWKSYNRLPIDIQILANKSYNLLKHNPSHPSLHFKRWEIANSYGQLESMTITDRLG